jgi:hypothetical protein
VGLFLLVRMGLVHMWAFYLKSYGFNEIRKIIFGPMYICGAATCYNGIKYYFVSLFN